MSIFSPKTISIVRQGSKLFWEEDLSKYKVHKFKVQFERGLVAYVDVRGYFDNNSLLRSGEVYNLKDLRNCKIYVIDQKRNNTGFVFQTGGSINLFYKKDNDYTLQGGYTASVELCIADGQAFLNKYRDLSPEEVIHKLQEMCYTESLENSDVYLGSAIKQVVQAYVNEYHVIYDSNSTYSFKDMQDLFKETAINVINDNLRQYGFNCINFSFKFNTIESSDNEMKKLHAKEGKIVSDSLDEKSRRIRKEDQQDDRQFAIDMEKAKHGEKTDSGKTTECPYCHKKIRLDKNMKHCPYCGMYIGG